MDRSHEWFPGLILCRSQMETEAANRIWRERHKEEPFHDGTFQNWAKNFTEQTPYRFDDGAQVIATPVDIGLGENFVNPLGLQDDSDEGGGPDGGTS